MHEYATSRNRYEYFEEYVSMWKHCFKRWSLAHFKFHFIAHSSRRILEPFPNVNFYSQIFTGLWSFQGNAGVSHESRFVSMCLHVYSAMYCNDNSSAVHEARLEQTSFPKFEENPSSHQKKEFSCIFNSSFYFAIFTKTNAFVNETFS